LCFAGEKRLRKSGVLGLWMNEKKERRGEERR